MSGRPPNPAEAARLVELVGSLYRRGYKQGTIAHALGIGRQTVADYVKRAGVEDIRRGRYVEPTEPLGVIEWRDRPVIKRGRHVRTAAPVEPEPVPMYRRSTTVALLAALVRELRNDNAENRFAGDVRDAIAAEDWAWLNDAAASLADVRAYLDRLVEVRSSRAARDRALTDPTRRDDLAGWRAL